jgi:hypothetical protein
VLAEGGVAFVEIGAGQAAIVGGLAEAHGFRCAFRRDLAGIDRVAVLRRQRETDDNGAAWLTSWAIENSLGNQSRTG